MGNFMHTAFKAYCGVLLGPVWSATCDIGINTINSLVNMVKFAMDDWFNYLGATLTTVQIMK